VLSTLQEYERMRLFNITEGKVSCVLMKIMLLTFQFVRFEVLMAVKMTVSLFWVLMPSCV
jgi:hypothetical protein